MHTTLENITDCNPAAPIQTFGPQMDAQRDGRIEAACAQACAAIAPAWPLDRSIAVNPHWSRIGLPVRSVAARMAVLAGIRVFPTRDVLSQAWNEGRISAVGLEQALSALPATHAAGLTPAGWREALCSRGGAPQLPLLIDVLDNDPQRHTRLSWRQAITHQVSQTCAAYFDTHQADWRPEAQSSLYAFWRDTLQHDHGIGMLMGIPDLEQRLGTLPPTRAEAERWVLQRLGLPESVWVDYLEAVLLTVNGWASWCAYLQWQAGQEGRQDEHLRELLAIRLAWGAIVLDCKDDAAAQHAFAALQTAWRHAPEALQQAEATLVVEEVGQLALEATYQQQLASRLSSAAHTPFAPDAIEVQVAFCIDVRSEPMRRAIETVWPAVQTIGFAGFFGLPVAYTPLGTQARRPQLPGLLAPAMEVSDSISAEGSAAASDSGAAERNVAQARQDRFGWSTAWQSTRRWPSAAFSFVEAAGVGYLGKFGEWLVPSRRSRSRDDLAGLPTRYRQICRPGLVGLNIASKAELAARVLHAMGLERSLAPMVVLVGHGSQSANNAHAAALDCGACCGQTGEVNARVLARLLNEAPVRQALREQGIVIPDATVFVSALHNTTTDEIEGFDLDTLSTAARQRWDRLAKSFEHAGDQVRRERAPTLGLDPRAGQDQLLTQLRRRANDGAQTRPEWGLAGNAAFIIAPRQRTRGVVLEGRSFLHDYDASQDKDGSVLELLMTAPMLVTHWINWQYHASTCDPTHFGSGNKVLQNVVGGHIGVFEGNGGDLRIGLSRQSLHDGKRWMHEPLRLTVVIDAPSAMIEAVIHKHAVVAQLLDNDWLHLWRFEGTKLQRYVQGKWQRVVDGGV